tara:strand:- start:6780 stop:9758 length:2979 start_codon:yes stop_codon:yes gene_type:complete
MAVDTYKINLDIIGLNKLAKYQSELRKTNKELSALEAKVKKQKGANAAQASSIAKLTVKQAELKKSVRSHTNSLTSNTAATKKNTAATRSKTAATKKGTAATLKMGVGIATAIQSLRRLGTFLLGSVKDFAAFELGVKNTTTLLSAKDTSLFSESFYNGVINLSKDYGLSLDDVNKSMFNAVSAGIKGGEAVKFLAEASELAIAGVTTLKSATTGLTTVLNAYSMDASEAARVSEILFTTQKFGVTTVEELSKSLGVVVPFAAASGISFEELGAAIATTTRSGLDAAKTVTALRAAISQMQKPAAASRDIFIKWGIPIGSAQLKAVGFTETLKRLNKAFKESPSDIEAMFGNVRGLTAIFSLAGENADTYHQVLEELQDSTLTAANLQKALAENTDSASKKLDKLSSAYKGFKVAVGESDIFQGMAESLTGLFNVLSSDNLSAWEKFMANVGLGSPTADLEAIAALAIAKAREQKIEADDYMKKLRAYEDFKKTTASINKKYVNNEAFSLSEITFMEEVVSQEALAGYNASLGFYVKSYKEHLDKIDAADDAAKAKRDAADKVAAENKMSYNAIERQSRIDLDREIRRLETEALSSNQYHNVVELEQEKSKLKQLELAYSKFNKLKIKDEVEKNRLLNEMQKTQSNIEKKSAAIDAANRKPFDDLELLLEKDKAAKMSTISLEEQNSKFKDKKQFQKKLIQLEIDHYKNLLMVSSRFGGASPEEVAGNEAKLAAAQARMAKTDQSIAKENRDKKIDIAKQGFDLILDAAKAAAEAELENEQRKIDKKKTINDQAATDGLINSRVAMKRNDDLDKEAFNLRKKHEIKMAKISLIQELGNIAIMAAANPTNAITFGAAGISQYAILAGLALGRYAMNVDTIKSQKFAKGGMVYGNSHAQGGEKFAVGGRVAELEGGEAVINKKSTAMFGGALSAMNVAGGGNSFSSPNLGGGGGLIDYNTLGSVIGRNTNVVLPVESLRRTQNRVETIESNSKF